MNPEKYGLLLEEPLERTVNSVAEGASLLFIASETLRQKDRGVKRFYLNTNSALLANNIKWL